MRLVDQDLGAGGERRLSRDAEEFRAFYGAALPRVYGYLLHRCGSSATAEDLTQETFLAAVVECAEGEADRRAVSAGSWGLRDTSSSITTGARIGRGRSSTPRSPSTPAERPVDSDGRAITALASVPGDQRIALVLRHVDGLSVPEVAAALGRSVEAAESLLARGRVRFRQAYMEVSAVSERDPLELLAQVGRAAQPRTSFAESLLAECLEELQAPARLTLRLRLPRSRALRLACGRGGGARARGCGDGDLPCRPEDRRLLSSPAWRSSP